MRRLVLVFLAGCVAAPDAQTSASIGAVAPPADGLTAAKLVFAADFTQHREGVLAAGGSVEIDYATARLDGCAEVQGGHDLWALTAHLRFDPGEELLDVDVTDGPGTLAVPVDARGVAVWFEATSASGCHQWDSNYGANYFFAAATPPNWLGLAENLIVRDADDPCDGGSDASNGFSFDTWARQQAGIANLCFQVYQPGVTDTDANPWQSLDTSVHWKLGSQTAWTVTPVDFDRRDGNNARYKWSWRDVDPFRANHCPEVAATPDGDYVQIGVEYYITVNGAEIRPEPGAAFGGAFIDYPSDPWRTANCGSSI